MFGQATVSSFIELKKVELPNIKGLIGLAQSMTDILSNEEISSIAFVSMVFGGSVWTSLPKMLNSLESTKL